MNLSPKWSQGSLGRQPSPEPGSCWGPAPSPRWPQGPRPPAQGLQQGQHPPGHTSCPASPPHLRHPTPGPDPSVLWRGDLEWHLDLSGGGPGGPGAWGRARQDPRRQRGRTGLRGALGTHRAGPGWMDASGSARAQRWQLVRRAHRSRGRAALPWAHPWLRGPGTPMGHNGQLSLGTSERRRRAAPLVESVGGTTRPSFPLLPLGGVVQAQVTPGGQLHWGDALGAEDIGCPTEVGLPPTP